MTQLFLLRPLGAKLGQTLQNASLNPATGHSIFASRPELLRVIHAVRMSGPPKQSLVVRKSGVSTTRGAPPSGR